MAPSGVEELGATDVELMQRYWLEEPWGSWRDNVHAALIALEIRRANFKGQHHLKDFMLVNPVQQDAKADRASVFEMFKAMARGKRTKAKPE